MNKPTPAVIGGIGALLLFAACMHSANSDSTPTAEAGATGPPVAPATVTVTATVTATPYVGPPNTAAGIPPAVAVTGGSITNQPTWEGQIRVTDLGVKFEAEPPDATSGGPWGGFYFRPSDSGGSGGYRIGGDAAVWPGGSDPTYDQCMTQILTQPLAAEEHNYPYSAGTAFCFAPQSGKHVVFIRSLSKQGAGLQVKAIQWRKATQ